MWQYNRNLKRLQSSLDSPLLVKKPENLFYLTGRSFFNGWLLVKKRGAIFLGDGLEQAHGMRIDKMKNISRHLDSRPRLALENVFTFAELDYLKLKIPGLKTQIAASPVDRLREIKDRTELNFIAESARITEAVFKSVKKVLSKKTWTEQQLAQYIIKQGLRNRADGVSFNPIVASGPNAAVPHHQPNSRRLRPEESIILDFGFKYRGYCSDFTRTVFLKKPTERLANMYRAVWDAHDQCIQQARPGLSASELYRQGYKILEKHRLHKYFIHNLGHGVGLEIHEFPNLSPVSKDSLRPGAVITIEPGVYLAKVGGVRIEDLLYLDHEKARNFYTTPTDLKSNIIK